MENTKDTDRVVKYDESIIFTKNMPPPGRSSAEKSNMCK